MGTLYEASESTTDCGGSVVLSCHITTIRFNDGIPPDAKVSRNPGSICGRLYEGTIILRKEREY